MLSTLTAPTSSSSSGGTAARPWSAGAAAIAPLRSKRSSLASSQATVSLATHTRLTKSPMVHAAPSSPGTPPPIVMASGVFTLTSSAPCCGARDSGTWGAHAARARRTGNGDAAADGRGALPRGEATGRRKMARGGGHARAHLLRPPLGPFPVGNHLAARAGPAAAHQDRAPLVVLGEECAAVTVSDDVDARRRPRGQTRQRGDDEPPLCVRRVAEDEDANGHRRPQLFTSERLRALLLLRPRGGEAPPLPRDHRGLAAPFSVGVLFTRGVRGGGNPGAQRGPFFFLQGTRPR